MVFFVLIFLLSLFLRPITQAWLGIHIHFSLFSGISVRDHHFAPSRLGSEYSLVPKRTNMEFDFEGKGIIIITCALGPFILHRNYATGNIDSLVSYRKEPCHSISDGSLYPTTIGV